MALEPIAMYCIRCHECLAAERDTESKAIMFADGRSLDEASDLLCEDCIVTKTV